MNIAITAVLAATSRASRKRGNLLGGFADKILARADGVVVVVVLTPSSLAPAGDSAGRSEEGCCCDDCGGADTTFF